MVTKPLLPAPVALTVGSKWALEPSHPSRRARLRFALDRVTERNPVGLKSFNIALRVRDCHLPLLSFAVGSGH